MSKAFQDKWNRMSANKRLLAVIVYMSKRGPIHINEDLLEDMDPRAGVVQSFENNDLVLTYVPPDTKVFFLAEEVAMQRTPSTWQETETTPPPRLRDLMEESPAGPSTTMDDFRMAQREAAIARAEQVAEQARRSRQPLPVPTPMYPPAKP